MTEVFTLQDITDGVDGYLYQTHSEHLPREERDKIRDYIVEFIRLAKAQNKEG